MGELLNRLSLYAAVDLAVQEAVGREDRVLLERVAAVIPAYRFDLRRRDEADDTGARKVDAAGWSDDAAELIGRQEPWPEATDALQSMADTSPPTAVDAGRRIKAIWMLIHAGIVDGNAPRAALERVVQEFPPDRSDRSERSTAARAGLAAPGDNDEPIDLYDHLLDLETAQEYRERLMDHAPKFVSAAVVAAAATTCDDSTEYVTPDGSDTDVAAVITTRTTRPVDAGLTLATLRDRLHPDRWPLLLPSFWCGMLPCGPDVAAHVSGVSTTGFTRQEVVGDFGTPPRGPAWTPPIDGAGADATCPETGIWFRPILRFRHRDVPDGFELQFRLAEHDEPGSNRQDNRFLVDAGAMSTRLHDGVVEVATSKVLLMSGRISGVGLGIFACAMGYGDMGAAMLEGALAN